jgi:hypothetical protein
LLNIFHHAIIKHGSVKINLVELVKESSSKEEADDRCPFCRHQKIESKLRPFLKELGADNYDRIIELVKKEIEVLEKEIRELRKKHFPEEYRLLKSIPGIGG